jgi:GPH family glycoside/pentoside/hexuronide:cation symporter
MQNVVGKAEEKDVHANGHTNGIDFVASAPAPPIGETYPDASHPVKQDTGEINGEASREGDARNSKAESKSSADSSQILPMKTKLLLSIGESVQGIWAAIAGFYLNTYFLEVCCLDPGNVGAIQLIQGSFDAFNDPLIGYLSDHTRTRWGRRRPWLLFGGPLLAVSYFCLWSKVPGDFGDFENFLYYLLCYMGVSVGVTCVQIQIASLAPELTDDYDERTLISAYRLAAVVVSSLICLLLHGLIVKLVPTPADGFRVSGAVFACVILCCTWMVFAGIREKFVPEQQSTEVLSICQELSSIARNRAFRCVIIVYLCGPTAVVLVQTNVFMYCKYVLLNEDLIFLLILATQGTAMLSAPFWVIFGKRFGKRQMYFLGGPILSISMFSLYFAESQPIAVLIAFFIGTSLAVVYLAPYSLLPDVIEDDELRTGKRREGIFSGFFTIALKLTVTLAMTLTNMVLKGAGYESPVATCADAATQDTNLPDYQPPAVIQSIRWLAGPIPAMLVLVALTAAWAFPITRESHAAVAAATKEKRQDRKRKLQEGSAGEAKLDEDEASPSPESTDLPDKFAVVADDSGEWSDKEFGHEYCAAAINRTKESQLIDSMLRSDARL